MVEVSDDFIALHDYYTGILEKVAAANAVLRGLEKRTQAEPLRKLGIQTLNLREAIERPDDLRALVLVLQSGLELFGTRIQELEAKLDEIILRDPVTGFFNLTLLHDTLRKEMHRAERSNSTFYVLFIGLDCFNAYINSYGSMQAKQALSAIANALRESFRPYDPQFENNYLGESESFRSGNAQFAVIFSPSSNTKPELLENIGEKVGERVRANIEACIIPTVKTDELPNNTYRPLTGGFGPEKVTARITVISYTGSNQESVDEKALLNVDENAFLEYASETISIAGLNGRPNLVYTIGVTRKSLKKTG